MGQLAFLKMFLLVSIPTDVNDNRRHVHVFKKGTAHAFHCKDMDRTKRTEMC